MAWNGIQILDLAGHILHVYTNASGSKGLGGIFGDSWFSARCPCQFHSRDIQFKEIYAVLQAVLRWGHLWKGHDVVFHINNSAIVSALASGTFWNAQVMNMLRMIIMLAVWLGFTYSSIWLTSDDNLLADTASQFEYARLFTTSPSMQKSPCWPHPQTHGIKLTLTCPTGLHSFFGMALPPQPT